MAKISVSIDDELLERVENYAKRNYSNRSAVITASLNQYLLNDECLQAIKGTALAMRKIADSGAVDDDTMKRLEDYDRFFEFYLNGKH